MAFLAWTVVNAHYPALFIGGFLFFLGFVRATAAYPEPGVDCARRCWSVSFSAGWSSTGACKGGGLRRRLRASRRSAVLRRHAAHRLNDNALITYLATLVPELTDPLKLAVVQGAVTGGGLTVIANAPNPAGQALLARFFGGAIYPIGLLAAAIVPTIIAVLAFRLL